VPPRRHFRASWILGALSLGVGGCSSGILTPTFPQLQEVGEIGEYGTERFRASDACRKASTSIETYLQCMKDKGWEFVERGTIYPAPECWSLRTAGDPRQLPTAQCFQRSATSPAAPRTPSAGS
jgi:hypothetical protein